MISYRVRLQNYDRRIPNVGFGVPVHVGPVECQLM